MELCPEQKRSCAKSVLLGESPPRRGGVPTAAPRAFSGHPKQIRYVSQQKHHAWRPAVRDSAWCRAQRSDRFRPRDEPLVRRPGRAWKAEQSAGQQCRPRTGKVLPRLHGTTRPWPRCRALAALAQGRRVHHRPGVVPVPPRPQPLQPHRQRLTPGLRRPRPGVPPVRGRRPAVERADPADGVVPQQPQRSLLGPGPRRRAERVGEPDPGRVRRRQAAERRVAPPVANACRCASARSWNRLVSSSLNPRPAPGRAGGGGPGGRDRPGVAAVGDGRRNPVQRPVKPLG